MADLKELIALGPKALEKRLNELIRDSETSMFIRAQGLVDEARAQLEALAGLAAVKDIVKEAAILQVRDFDLQGEISMRTQPYAELVFSSDNRRLSTSSNDYSQCHGAPPLPPGKYRLVVALLPIAPAKKA